MCEIIAEAGVNHNGKLDLALQLVDVAAEAGAGTVKFQTFNSDSLAAADAPLAAYQARSRADVGAQLDMLRQLELPRGDWEVIAERCRERHVRFLSTPFDMASAELLVDLGVDAIKVPSGELTNTPFLVGLARFGLPLLVSTGMSTLLEVEEAVGALRGAGAGDLTLLHCVSCYPTLPADANLRAMDTLRDRFGIPVGWSDHTEGIWVSVAAIARGATVVEKHFTLSRALEGPDHAASLEPAELATLVNAARDVVDSLGSGVKEPRPCEAETALVARRSLHFARSLRAGMTIGEADLKAVRPGGGIPPSRVWEVVGRAIARDVAAGEIASWEAIQ